MKLDRIMSLKWSYPDFPPRPIKRDVMFSLMSYQGGLYFVNGSEDVLDIVSSESFGFVLDSALDTKVKFHYAEVKPGESVKVEEYDDFYDLDFVLGLEIYIESKSIGKLKIKPPSGKGGVKKQELIFKDMTTPRYVSFERIK